ncbi:hypothetical protein Ddc_19458 [Ditylenchus destructor]|nr:hypothetical protein Ddc_19458 [Ditylenchus destructor]
MVHIKEGLSPQGVPPLAFGWATLYSNKAIKEMLRHAHEVNSFAVEDVFYSGVLAEKAAVRKIDFSKHFQFNYGRGILVECDKEKVPLVTVACCFYSHSSIVKAYEKLKSIQCPRRNADLFYSLYIKL